MIIKKFKFSLSTRYVGSEVSEKIEIELDENDTPEEIDNKVSDAYNEWLGDHNYGGFHEIESP